MTRWVQERHPQALRRRRRVVVVARGQPDGEGDAGPDAALFGFAGLGEMAAPDEGLGPGAPAIAAQQGRGGAGDFGALAGIDGDWI
jgi:hypothetical protein